MAAQFSTLERIRLRILEFTCGPNDVLGHETPFIEVEVIQTVVLLDGVDVRVFQDGNLEERGQVVQVLSILLASGVFHLHAERR